MIRTLIEGVLDVDVDVDEGIARSARGERSLSDPRLLLLEPPARRDLIERWLDESDEIPIDTSGARWLVNTHDEDGE